MIEGKLPKDLKDPWLRALRSDEYKQGAGQLRTDTPEGPLYCVLGIFGVANGIPISDDGMAFGADASALSNDGYEPIERHIGRENTKHLYSLNDTYKKSFEELADHIESNL